MDRPSSLRLKQTITYGKRNQRAGSAHLSPAAAKATLAATSSSGSSDDDAGSSNPQRRRVDKTDLSPRIKSNGATNVSPKHKLQQRPIIDNISPQSKPSSRATNGASAAGPAATTPTGLRQSSSSRAALTSTSHSTPQSFPSLGSSSNGLSSAKSLPQRLPQRPARAASPSASKSERRPSACTLSAKRSASTSPRKQSSVSPSKRVARSRTPSRPAQDLASLFDAIEPTLPHPRNPFARSESQPTVQLHLDDAQASFGAADSFANSPLQSPTLPSIGLEDARLLSPGTQSSPSKRPRMADRMAPRAERSTKSKVDEIAEALNTSRRGSLRRTETAPSAISDTGSIGLFASDGERPNPFRVPEEEVKSAHLPDAGSGRIYTASQADSQSQEGASLALGARRLAGIKQNSATNARRTYGLQRSFLADQAEENLLSESAPLPTSSAASRTMEEEIEAELRGQDATSTPSYRPSAPVASRLPDPASAAPRESYAELLKKWGEGADDIEWDESQDPTLNLKSITSLRSQGELRRFNDDLEYLISGLDASQGLSIRKSSAVELIRLLCGRPDIGNLNDDADNADQDVEDLLASAQSAGFLRKLKASDLITRLFDLFKGAEAGEGVDDVLDAAIAVYVAKLLKTASSAEALARERWSDLHATLRELLARASRASRHRKDGFALLRLHELKQHKITTRSDRKILDELQAIARISKLFVSGAKSWTLRNLVLAACCSLIILPRRLLTETAINDLLVGEDGAEDRTCLFTSVLNVLISEGDKAQKRLTDFAKGLALVSAAVVEAIPDLETVDICIRFLDKGMDALYLELDQAVPASNETLNALQHLISFAIQAAPFGARSPAEDADFGHTGASPTRALQVLCALFKTLLDLSQVDANWSESLASSRPLQASIMRAFLLSHRSAVRLRQKTVTINSSKRSKAKSQGLKSDSDSTWKLDVALFNDVVHLSLAVLTNLLIKQLDKARDILESVQLEPGCWGRRSCLISCTCEDRLYALRLLARLFFETRIAAASDDDSDAAYLSNSIATAIAQYAVGGPARLKACRAVLDVELPSSESKGSGGVTVIKADGFETLLDAVEEFAVVHEAALNAGRLRAVEAVVGQDQMLDDGEETKLVKDEDEGDSSNPVAMEAGQLIKDLAVTLRQMA
ncbi:uncharacterized protein MEPE_05047 [Melanopsichium pennsylvanicum]|uniref:Wings apart-like protein C-terminal domain-containing protein n=2 Tax=Melanopsichium pennsylvanicum TaxID=63383 RepID=A0AAJ5C799_9BASI|nr:hypothetical protein BN887_00344 [Melanopsichium pennsylvanicum 4]SNX86338.1 uncharacterized protein MEPE_05047 [Melanopsichium pennsylvanicum]